MASQDEGLCKCTSLGLSGKRSDVEHAGDMRHSTRGRHGLLGYLTGRAGLKNSLWPGVVPIYSPQLVTARSTTRCFKPT